MTRHNLSRYAILGLALTIAGPALANGDGDDVRDYLSAPGVGVVADIGNNKAADVPMFDTREHPKPLWVYGVDAGKHVLRDGGGKSVGNSRAANVPMFDYSENPKPLWIYDVDAGKHVARNGATQPASLRAEVPTAGANINSQ